ncbi:hypothetical protein LTR17_005286 [Elasticomyces elasticus]|nr:hypothetical protein LTR27_004654 [Elasticomyces elasticus]KAK5739381.1 hypothetical protein LTR17_005286 [Elasticomyces elasticus]
MAPTLAPVNPTLGPQPASAHLYSAHQTTLIMKEKVFSLSGDDFTVRTVDGMDVCKCKGKVVSMRDSKKFTDVNGTELFTLKNKMLSIHKSFVGNSPTGHDFEVKGHFKLMGSKSSVHFKNASDGSEVELEVKGDWFDRSAVITFGGREVAAIARSFFNVREIFGDKQSYQVTVAAGVDLSLIAAICVALDEKENEAK